MVAEAHQVSRTTDLGAFIHAIAGGMSAPQQGILAITGAATHGETFTIGDKVFELLTFADSSVNVSGGDLNNTTNPVDVTFASHERTVGEYLLVESEFMKVIKVVDANTVRVARGQFGSTIAAHADATNIFENAAAPTAGTISVGLTDETTAATIVDDIVAAINAQTQDYGPMGFEVYDNDDFVVFQAPQDRSARATTETMANGAFYNGATMFVGIEEGDAKVCAYTRTIQAGETTPVFSFPFDVKNCMILIRSAAGAAQVYDGALTIVGRSVTVENGGSVDADATDVVTVVAFG